MFCCCPSCLLQGPWAGVDVTETGNEFYNLNSNLQAYWYTKIGTNTTYTWPMWDANINVFLFKSKNHKSVCPWICASGTANKWAWNKWGSAWFKSRTSSSLKEWSSVASWLDGNFLLAFLYDEPLCLPLHRCHKNVAIRDTHKSLLTGSKVVMSYESNLLWV